MDVLVTFVVMVHNQEYVAHTIDAGSCGLGYVATNSPMYD